MPFECRTTRTDGRCVLVVAGEIDLATAPQLADAVEEATSDADTLDIDLRDTTFIDSTGLAVLARATQRPGREPLTITLWDPSPQIVRVLAVSGVDALVRVAHHDAPPVPEVPAS
jgi:anti-sigma B factor antagonist